MLLQMVSISGAEEAGRRILSWVVIRLTNDLAVLVDGTGPGNIQPRLYQAVFTPTRPSSSNYQ